MPDAERPLTDKGRSQSERLGRFLAETIKRTGELVARYALTCANHLVARGVKAIVVACNTVSAVAPARRGRSA